MNVGDTLTVNGTRWVIRSLNRKTGAVFLVASNTTNHAMSWTTTLDKIGAEA